MALLVYLYRILRITQGLDILSSRSSATRAEPRSRDPGSTAGIDSCFAIED